MLPAVAEVVEVAHGPVPGGLEHVGQRGLGRGRGLVAAVVGVGQAPSTAGGLELVEVIVLPGHRGLQDEVQPIEPEGGRHLDAAGDGGLDLLERDVEAHDAHADRCQGIGSSSLVILWSGMRARVSASQASGSAPQSFAVSIRV